MKVYETFQHIPFIETSKPVLQNLGVNEEASEVTVELSDLEEEWNLRSPKGRITREVSGSVLATATVAGSRSTNQEQAAKAAGRVPGSVPE